MTREAWAQRVDRRKLNRVRIALQGTLLIAEEQRQLDCVVIDLSPGGAGIQCKGAPQRRSNVVLYVPGFGRFGGTTTQTTPDATLIGLECTPRKQNRTADQLGLCVKEGLPANTALRGSEHIKQVSTPSFTMPDGEVVECEVRDFPRTGTSLKTPERPPV